MQIAMPGKPVACSCGLLSMNVGLLWDIVAYNYGLRSMNFRLLWRIVAYGLQNGPRGPRRCQKPQHEEKSWTEVTTSRRDKGKEDRNSESSTYLKS